MAVPLPIFVACDLPIRRRIFFQTWLTMAVWYCAFFEVAQIYEVRCLSRPSRGLTRRAVRLHPGRCRRRASMWRQGLSVRRRGKAAIVPDHSSAMSMYATAIPALALFSIGSRSAHFFASIICGAFLIGFVAVDTPRFTRVIVCYALVHIFLLFLSYSHDITDRRVWTSAFALSTRYSRRAVNHSLKRAYQAQQRAQAAESHASNSKRRFVSYIFHVRRLCGRCSRSQEVRVPVILMAFVVALI